MSDDPIRPRAPRALSLRPFQFNFKVSVGAQIAARGGAPAFATRRERWDQAERAFWAHLEARHRALWIAAGEGRIDDEGREVRMSLLDSDGRDTHALRLHKQDVFSVRGDLEQVQRTQFDRAWRRALDRLDLGPLEGQAESYRRYFPIEANLPMDPETGRYLWLGRRWVPVRAPTREDVLARYPLFGDEPG